VKYYWAFLAGIPIKFTNSDSIVFDYIELMANQRYNYTS